MSSTRVLLVILLSAFALPSAAQDAAPAQVAPVAAPAPKAPAPEAPAPAASPVPAAPEPTEASAPAAAPVPAAPAPAPAEAPAPVVASPVPGAPAPVAAAPVPAPAPQPYFVPQASYQSPLRTELAQVDARLDEIRHERPGLAGPIALTAVGGGTALVSAYVALMLWVVTEPTGYDDRYHYRGSYYDDRSDSDRRAMRGLAVLSLGGLATAVGGLVWMSNRLRDRRTYKPEIDALKSRRRLLLQEVRYGANAHGQHYGLSMAASF